MSPEARNIVEPGSVSMEPKADAEGKGVDGGSINLKFKIRVSKNYSNIAVLLFDEKDSKVVTLVTSKSPAHKIAGRKSK